MESNHPTGGLLRPAGFEDRMGHQTPAAPPGTLAAVAGRRRAQILAEVLALVAHPEAAGEVVGLGAPVGRLDVQRVAFALAAAALVLLQQGVPYAGAS